MSTHEKLPAAAELEAIAARLRTLGGVDPLADSLAGLVAAFREAVARNMIAEEQELALCLAAGGRLN